MALPSSGPCSFRTKLFILASPTIAYRVRTHASCWHNELAALTDRHLIAPARDPDLTYIRQSVKEILPTLVVPGLRKVSHWDIARNYVGGKRRMYMRAAELIDQVGWRDTWANVSMFVKPDKYPEGAISTKAPRAIQYRHPAYNLLVGKYLHVYEHALYTHPDGVSQTPWLAKGKNQQQRAQILLDKIACFKDPLFVCLDHSRFDSTIGPELLVIEQLVYWRQFKSKFLRFLLRKQLNNKGYSKSGIKYFVKGTRMSGDYNTGLGNSIINYLCLRSWLKNANARGEIFLDGDDSIVIVEAADFSKLDMNHFSRFGFKTKMGTTRDVTQVEFCQSRLLPSGPVMARNPFRALSHLAVSIKGYPAKTWPRIQQARGMCEALGSSGVPILEAYGKALMCGVKPLFDDQDYQKWLVARTTEKREITDEVRLEFYNAWGIDPYSQELIEESFSDPQLLSVLQLRVTSDNYDSESLQAAWERWLALDADSGTSCWASREGGMEVV